MIDLFKTELNCKFKKKKKRHFFWNLGMRWRRARGEKGEGCETKAKAEGWRRGLGGAARIVII